jgi:hypothetical protein
MTPQELAELPKGTRVRFFIDETQVHDEITKVYDYGKIAMSGAVTHVAWEDFGGGSNSVTTLIDTKSKVWEAFIGEMEVCD